MNNSIKKSLLSFACLLLWAFTLNAQVNGTVRDGHGHILQGVLITSEWGNNKTITDRNGEYDILINDGSSTLNFSLQGYISQNLEIDEQAAGEKLDVTLQRAETFDLDEEVFFGNYAQTRKELPVPFPE